MFDPLINESQSLEIEAVQRNCLQIILGASCGSYSTNLSALGLSSLADRRLVLVRQFAIACYRSPIHRWWFTPHPVMPLGTRYRSPRFLVPKCRLQRDHKRPIVAYSEVLNGLSEEEWAKLKLPPVSSVQHASNKQLSDLANPSFQAASDVTKDTTVNNVATESVVEVEEVKGAKVVNVVDLVFDGNYC